MGNMMVDYDGDGISDSMDMTARIVGMEAMRVIEAVARRITEDRREDTRRSEEVTRESTARYEANAALARRDLAPVARDDWWDSAGLDAIREKYVTALAFSRVDDRFTPARERIEERARALRDAGPEQILRGTVRPGPQPMGDSQMRWAMNNVAPDWYKAWAAEQVRSLDKIKDAGGREEGHLEHARLVQSDLEHWRDHGALSVHAQDLQQSWRDGELSARRVDPEAGFVPLTDDQRHELGWRPGGPRVLAALDVDDARLLAATTAPGWYRLQDLVAQDQPPAVRERLESRLVEDMTQLRDEGRLDTASAREEWARFSGHPMAAAVQDENESLSQFQDRRVQAFDVHWAGTEPDREHVSTPGGDRVGKPMSVSEAEEFAQQYAPFWLRERHDAVLAEAGQHEDPGRAAWEQTSVREQFRYAMETARDTGGLGHPYAQALRSQAALLGVDDEEGMRHVPPGDRVRFGGPAARPMSEPEALEVMDGWAPSWYQDQVRRTLRENTMIGDAAKRVELDAVRADMTVLRDRGVLSSDHAQRLWAASQPGFNPSHYESRAAMDSREQLWAETVDTREQPKPMDPNNRERLGGTREADTAPIPVVPSPERRPEATATPGVGAHATRDATAAPAPAQDRGAGDELPGRRKRGPVYDSVERRQQDAAQLRARGHERDAVDAKTVDDYGHPRNPAKGAGGGKPPKFDQWRERSAQAHRPKGRGR